MLTNMGAIPNWRCPSGDFDARRKRHGKDDISEASNIESDRKGFVGNQHEGKEKITV
jgi:hypothetical protein